MLSSHEKEKLTQEFASKYSADSLIAQYYQEVRYLDEVENPVETYQKQRGIDLVQFLDILWNAYNIKLEGK